MRHVLVLVVESALLVLWHLHPHVPAATHIDTSGGLHIAFVAIYIQIAKLLF